MTSSAAQATIYTTLGQTLRVPLGASPENQLISWLHRQMAANPAFPVRVRSILLLTGRRANPAGQQALRRFLSRWQLARQLRVVSTDAPPMVRSQEVDTAAFVRHPRIDVAAQRALLRMLRSPDSFLVEAANGLLDKMSRAEIAGIFQEDQQVPALQARRLGLGWWQLIPPDSDWQKVDNSPNPPLIVFRRAIRNDARRMEDALLAANMAPLAPPPRGLFGRPL